MKKYLKNPLVITLLVLVAIFAYKFTTIGLMIYKMTHQQTPPTIISAGVAKAEVWSKSYGAVTKLASSEGAVLKAEQPGSVQELNVTAGQQVKKGDLLLVIDANSERAAAKLAKLNYERAVELHEKGVNTQNDLDTAEANYAQAKAALDKKEIRAPFDGKVGINQVFLGQYVTVGTPLIAIESLKTMQADFGVPQQMIGLLKVGAAVELHVDAFPGQTFVGKIDGFDPRVEESTLNVNVRAVFDNAEGKLLSGMFGSLELTLNDATNVVVVPATAIVYSAYGNSVYVLREEENATTKAKELVARQQFVKLGGSKGDFISTVEGLKEGDQVVTAGQMKLRNGAAVKVDNTLETPSSQKPTPTES